MKHLKIEEFTDVITGGTPSTNKSEYWNGDIPWLNSGELNRGIITSSSNFISEKGLANSAAKMMPVDTVLIALTGATTGISALLKIEACANQSVTGILPSKQHLPKYLLYYLRHTRRKIIDLSYGGAQKHISQGFVKKLDVPLPSLEMQERIVDLLDQADSLRQKRVQAINLLDEYLKSIFLEMFGDPVLNPKKWESVSLKDVATVKIGPFGSLLHTSDYVTGGVPLVNPTHIINKKIVIDENLTVDPIKYKELSSYYLKTGDVVLGRRGEIGRCGLVTSKEDGYICGTGSMLIRPRSEVNSIFLLDYMSSDSFKKKLESKAIGITMKNLNARTVENMHLFVPPIEKQNTFAQIVLYAMETKQRMLAQSLELDYQFNALMQKSFEEN